MKKIASFTIDHIRLLPGVYVSRTDKVGKEIITTFDLRFTAPNREPVLDVPATHTIEHVGATFLRSHPTWGNRDIYFGPMGCRTGFYLVLAGELTSADVLPLVKELAEFIASYDDEVPGAKPEECGNYLNHDLPMAKYEAKKYLDVLENATEANLNYPS